MFFLFIYKTLRLNNLKTRTAINVKISVSVICVEVIIYSLLYNLHDSTFKSYYWEKLTFSKLQFSKLKKILIRSHFGELQLTQISLTFKTSCNISKIRSLGAKLCVTFLLFLFWKELRLFKIKESMYFDEQKYKL